VKEHASWRIDRETLFSTYLKITYEKTTIWKKTWKNLRTRKTTAVLLPSECKSGSSTPG
jgi:hypothetical protein